MNRLSAKNNLMATYPWKKMVIFLVLALVAWGGMGPGAARDIFQEYEKVIWINQVKQVGTVYEQGKKLREFPILTGDDECTTDPGIYLVRSKVEDYYSRKYDTPMPFSLFFDMKHRKAIHEGGVPPPAERRELATHGCVHVEPPHMEWLYHWAEEGATAVVMSGWRTED